MDILQDRAPTNGSPTSTKQMPLLVEKNGVLMHAQQKFDRSSNLRFVRHAVWLDEEGIHWGASLGQEDNFLRAGEVARVESLGPIGQYNYSMKIYPISQAEERHIFACETYDEVYDWMGHICALCEIDFNPDEKQYKDPQANVFISNGNIEIKKDDIEVAQSTTAPLVNIKNLKIQIGRTREEINQVLLKSRQLMQKLAEKNIIDTAMEAEANAIHFKIREALDDLEELHMVSAIFYYEPDVVERLGINHQDVLTMYQFAELNKEVLTAMGQELNDMIFKVVQFMKEMAMLERREQLKSAQVEDVRYEIKCHITEIHNDLGQELRTVQTHMHAMKDELEEGDESLPLLNYTVQQSNAEIKTSAILAHQAQKKQTISAGWLLGGAVLVLVISTAKFFNGLFGLDKK